MLRITLQHAGQSVDADKGEWKHEVVGRTGSSHGLAGMSPRSVAPAIADTDDGVAFARGTHPC